MVDRLVLGTAQLGIRYGINNKTGKPDFKGALGIVKTAIDGGIFYFDTAQAYGNSEDILGRIFSQLKVGNRVKVFTKIDPHLELNRPGRLAGSVEESLRKLQIDRLEGLMLHHEEMLDLWNEDLRFEFHTLVRQGQVRKFGVSFYSPERALKALDLDEISFIQIPANIFDQRFKDQGVLTKARELNKEVFVRSIYLQGLLLMAANDIPHLMNYARDPIKRFNDLAGRLGVTRQELALDHIRRQYPDCFVVVGAESDTQIAETVRLFKSVKNMGDYGAEFRNIPENIVNPILWPSPVLKVPHG